MSDHRKPRSDSRLKNLPETRQAAIIELCKTLGFDATARELRKDGLQTSRTALSEFYSAWHLRQRFAQNERTVLTMQEELKRSVPSITDEDLDRLGQQTFSLLAIEQEDQKAFVQIRSARFKAEIEREKLRLRQEAEARQSQSLKLQREKFEFDGARAAMAHAAEIKAIASDMSMTEVEKIDAVRKRLFGVLPPA